MLADTSLKFGIPLGTMFSSMSQRYRQAHGIDYYGSLDFQVVVSEWDWIQNNRKIIFIEDKDTIDRLLNLKFKSSIASHVDMPYGVFTLAVPTGTKYNGIEIFPAMIRKLDNAKENILDFYKSHNIGYTDNSKDVKSKSDYTIFLPEKISGKGAKNLINVSNEQISSLLKIDLNDAKEIISVIGNIVNSATMSELEIKQIALTLRLTIAMAIFNSTTGGKHLRSGVPHCCASKLKNVGIKKSLQKNYSFNSIKLDQISLTGKAEHVRGEHMRQLTHEKYYNGEHESKQIGSRWVHVKETLIGRGDAHTLEGD